MVEPHSRLHPRSHPKPRLAADEPAGSRGGRSAAQLGSGGSLSCGTQEQALGSRKSHVAHVSLSCVAAGVLFGPLRAGLLRQTPNNFAFFGYQALRCTALRSQRSHEHHHHPGPPHSAGCVRLHVPSAPSATSVHNSSNRGARHDPKPFKYHASLHRRQVTIQLTETRALNTNIIIYRALFLASPICNPADQGAGTKTLNF